MAVALGQVVTDVTASDGDRDWEHLVEIRREGDRTFDERKRERRSLVIDEEGHPLVAADRSALERVGTRHEQQVLSIEDEPDRRHVRAPIRLHGCELASAGPLAQELLKLFVTHRVGHGELYRLAKPRLRGSCQRPPMPSERWPWR